MKRDSRCWGRRALAGVMCCAPWLAAQAALTDNLGTSVVAMSLGNAVTADPPGLDSIHFNPAGLARIEVNTRADAFFGASIRPYATFTQPDGFDIGGWKSDPIAGMSTSPVKQTLYIPGIGPLHARLPAAVGAGLGFALHTPNSKWTFATASYVPQAVGIDRSKNPNDPANYDGSTVIIQRLVFLSPSAAYKYSDTLSLGVSVPIAYQAFSLQTNMRMPNELLGIIGKLQQGWCGPNGGDNPVDEFGFGLCGGGKQGMLNPFNKVGAMQFNMTAPVDPTLNLGILWEPKDWFAAGAVYQFGSQTTLTGRFQFDAEPMLQQFVYGVWHSLQGPILASTFGMPTNIPSVQAGNASMTLPFPEHIQGGIKIKPFRDLQINVDANWTNWSRWNKLIFNFDQNVNLLEMARVFGVANPAQLVIPRGYTSPVHFGYGVDYTPGYGVHLRLGYEPRKSSVPQSSMDLISPLPNLNVKSIGLGYQSESGTRLDLTASYAHGSFNLPANTSCNLNCNNFFNVIYNPYAGLDVSGGIYVRYFGAAISRPF